MTMNKCAKPRCTELQADCKLVNELADAMGCTYTTRYMPEVRPSYRSVYSGLLCLAVTGLSDCSYRFLAAQSQGTMHMKPH